MEHEPYEVVEEDAFRFQAGEFAGSLARWHEIHETILNDLARNPLVGWGYPGVPGFYSIRISSTPELLLHYFVDDREHRIVLLEIESVAP